MADEVELVVADGSLLEQIAHSAVSAGLNGHEWGRLESARVRTAWGRTSRRRLAFLERSRLVASAMQDDFDAVYEGEHVRVSGISAVHLGPSRVARDGARRLIELVVERARQSGAAMILLVDRAGAPLPDGFESVALTDLTLDVAKPARYGAPMTMVRCGEERDLPAIVAMGRARAGRYRFHLDRTQELIQYAITTKRLLAGLAPAGTRQLQFFIAEEGTTAAAYVVISSVGGTWTIEECGDRDPGGARVGALLQALLAREPGEQRPAITAWLPPGFLPPQVTIAATAAAPQVLMVRDLRSAKPMRLAPDDVLFWHNDLLT